MGRPVTLKAFCNHAKCIYKQLVETTGQDNPDKAASKGCLSLEIATVREIRG